MRSGASKWMGAAVAGAALVVVAAGWLAAGRLALADEATEVVELKPVPVEGNAAKIGPQNTRVEFVGLHVGDDPKPRLGGFKEFSGVLVVEEGKLEKVSVEFEMDSLWTEFDKLTQHLQAADFFGVKDHPTAKFTSSKITSDKVSGGEGTPDAAAGEVTIAGTMNLHGVDSEIEFPAKVSVTDAGVTLESEFELDRSAFGMTDHLDSVEKLVQVRVVVGQATERDEADAAAESTGTQAQAGEMPESGLAVGQSVEPWTPVHVSGPDEGTRACPLCTYLARPAIVVFAKDGPNTESLLVAVEELLNEHAEQDLKGFVLVTGSTPERLQAMAAENQIVLTALCYPDDKTGGKDLSAYHVNPYVDNTVMIYTDYKVRANWVNLKSDELGKLSRAVDEMLE